MAEARPLSPTGYLQHLHDLFTGTATLGEATIDPETGMVPVEDDPPWTVVQTIKLKSSTSDPAAEEAAARFIREDYLQDPDSDGEIYTAADMKTAFLVGADWATFNRDI